MKELYIWVCIRIKLKPVFRPISRVTRSGFIAKGKIFLILEWIPNCQKIRDRIIFCSFFKGNYGGFENQSANEGTYDDM